MELTFSNVGGNGHIGHLVDGAERGTVHLVRHELVGPLVQPMLTFVERSQSIHSTFLPGAASAEMQRAAAPVLTALAGAIGAARKARSACAVASATAHEIPKSVDRTRFIEIRYFYNELSQGERDKRALTAPLVELAALVDGGDIVKLNAPIREEVNKRFVLAAHAERTGMTAFYQRKPTPDALTDIGPDADAVTDAAAEAWAEHTARAEGLTAVEASLQSVLAFMALALKQAPAATLEQALAA